MKRFSCSHRALRRTRVASIAALLLVATACGGSPTSPGGSNGCTVITGNTMTSFPAAGGSGSVSVSTTSNCTWGAVSNAAFLTVTQGASGSGNGTIQFAVATNTGSARTAVLTVTDTNTAFVDTTITITQSAP
jgi:hypothetical protein